ncbi:MAG: hypothetical protein M3O70_17500 [Actinomycetota bacterium]|nr:hypothetical protein [Actinomycetota bacterium]
MTTSRFGTLLGLAIGTVWVFAGFAGAALTAVLAAVGFLVALMVEGRVDVTEYLGRRHDE